MDFPVEQIIIAPSPKFQEEWFVDAIIILETQDGYIQIKSIKQLNKMELLNERIKG